MSKEDCIELEGKVIEVLPNAMFKVQLQNGKEILSHLSGKLRMNYIKILQGDNVKVEISPYDLTRGRITWRMKGTSKSAVPSTDTSTTVDNSKSMVQDASAPTTADNSKLAVQGTENLVTVDNYKSDSTNTSNLTKNK